MPATALTEPVRAAYTEVRQAIDERKARTPRRSDRAAADLLHEELRPGDTCVDVGAGVGLLAIVMANVVGPTGKVYAFEALAENGPKLLANARWCGLAERIELRITDAAVILDELLDAGRSVDLVHLSADGDLPAVLRGMREMLRRWRPTLLVECRSPAAWDACAELAQRGYTLRDTRRHEVDPAAAPPVARVLATHPQRSAA